MRVIFKFSKMEAQTGPEIFTEEQTYFPRVDQKAQKTSEFFRDALKPAGRFRSPLSFRQKGHLKFQELAHRYSEKYRERTNIISIMPHYPVPAEWQVLFTYLYNKKIARFPTVNFVKMRNDAPKFHTYIFDTANDESNTDGNFTKTIYCRGSSYDNNTALSKGAGELLERIMLSRYRKDEFFRASAAELKKSGKKFLRPEDASVYSARQKDKFPRCNFGENSPFYWIKGKQLDGKDVLLPAQMIFWNYSFHCDRSEPILREANSNGAAGHFSKEDAIVGGIYELVQRDGFLYFWLKGEAPPQIEHESIKNQDLRKLLADLKRYNFNVIFLDTKTDLGIPGCITVLSDNSSAGAKFAIGGGSDSSLERAMIDATMEAIMTHRWASSQKPKSLPENYEPFMDEKIDQHERILLWSGRETEPKMNFFLQGKKETLDEAQGNFPSHFENRSAELKYLAGSIQKKGKGYEIYYYERQDKILRTLGYHTVRVIIPALLPMYLRENNACLGVNRLGSDKFNPLPHPFP